MHNDMMRFINELGHNPDLKDSFLSALNLDEAVEIAKENGFNINVDELSEDNFIMDYIWELAAGGKAKNNLKNWIKFGHN